MKSLIFMGESGMITLSPTNTPIFICECKHPDDKPIIRIKEKECVACLTRPKRAALEEGKITVL